MSNGYLYLSLYIRNLNVVNTTQHVHDIDSTPYITHVRECMYTKRMHIIKRQSAAYALLTRTRCVQMMKPVLSYWRIDYVFFKFCKVKTHYLPGKVHVAISYAGVSTSRYSSHTERAVCPHLSGVCP
jgi:hypothetical protein